MASTGGRRPRSDVTADPLWPSIRIGAFAGTTGLVIGGAAGIIRNSSPVLFAAVSGLQWFGLGFTYWGTRSFLLTQWTSRGAKPTSRDVTTASTIGGGVAGGGVGLLSRGPRNVLPGVIMFSLFGFAGQSVYNMFDEPQSINGQAPQKSGNVWQWLASRKWTPFTALSDDDYLRMLKEKKFKLDVDIALIDDKIMELKRPDGSNGSSNGDEAPNSTPSTPQ